MAHSFSGTLTRVEYWERVFRRLQSCLSGLVERQESFLAVSFAYLLERSLADLQLPRSSSRITDPLQAGAEESALAAGLCWVRERSPAGRSAPAPSAEDGLQVLLLAAESILEDPTQYDFADALDEATLLREFRILASFTKESLEDVQLLSPRFLEFWLGMLGALALAADPLERLRLEAALLRVIRGVYALALGFERLGRGTDDLRQDLMLAHTIGQGVLGMGRP